MPQPKNNLLKEMLDQLQSIDWDKFQYNSTIPEEIDEARGEFIQAADRLEELLNRGIKD